MTKTQSLIKALRESLVVQAQEALDYTKLAFKKQFRSDLISAIDQANKLVEKTGVKVGRNADFELAVAIDPTEKTIQLKYLGDNKFKVTCLALHKNEEVVNTVVEKFVELIKAFNYVSDVVVSSVTPATEENSGLVELDVEMK